MTGSVSLNPPAAVSGRAAAARSPSIADSTADAPRGSNFGHALREQAAADSSRQDDAGDDVSPSSTQRPGVRGAKASRDRSPIASDDTNSEPVTLFSGPSMEPHVAAISIKIAAAGDDAQGESDQDSTSTDAAKSDSKAGGASSFFWYAGDVAVQPAASVAVDTSDTTDDSNATISSGMLAPPGAAGQIGGTAAGTQSAAGVQGTSAALGNISALAGAAALASVGTSAGAGASASATGPGAAGASASTATETGFGTAVSGASGSDSGASGTSASGAAAQAGQAASGASTAAARLTLSALLAQSGPNQFASGKGGERTDTGSDAALTGAPLTSQAQPWSSALTMAAQNTQTTSSPSIATNSAHQPLVQSLADRLHLQITNGSDQAVIRLDPPLRGSVEITIRHDENGVQVHLRASDGEVARQLRDVGEALRQDLTQRHAGEVTVQVSHGSRDSDGNRRDQQKLPNVPGRALSEAEEGGDTAAFSLGQPGSELA